MSDPCDGCGMCCMHVGLPPFTDAERDALPPELAAPLDVYETSPRYKVNSACVWLDVERGRCRHYERRPRSCRLYTVGSPSCVTQRRFVGLSVEGMNYTPEATR